VRRQLAIVRDRLYQGAKRAQRRWLIADYEELRLREKWLEHDRELPFEEVVVPVAPDVDEVRTVLVFTPDAIGDAVHALPAVAELRRHLPHARFFLLCRGLTAPLYARSGLFEEIAVVELGSRTRPSLRATRPALRQLSRGEFDLAVFLRTNQAGFRRFLRIPARARVHPLDPRLRSTSPYQARVARWGDVRVHQSLQHLQIVSVVTGRRYSLSDVRFPELHWVEDDFRAHELVFDGSPPPAYLVAHPFAKEETRRYPADYWRTLLDGLRNATGMPIVVVGGPDDSQLDDPPGLIQMQGRLSLMQTAWLISRTAGFIGNVSGPAHLSAALGRPTITLMSGNSLPVEWAPLGDSLVIRADVPCSPCHREFCPGYGLACLRSLTPQRVLPAAVEFLRRPRDEQRAWDAQG
jgi:ADP-heptose:LPS heptosyltransferase